MDEDMPAPRGRRGWDVLRAVLIVLWLVAAAMTWWTAPRKASYERASADVVAQRVTAYQWGDSWQEVDGPRPWFSDAHLSSSDTLGPVFAWRTGDGRVHWADTGDFAEVQTTGAVAAKDYSGPGAVGLAESLRAAGLQGRFDYLHTPGNLVGGIGILLGLTFFVVLVAGPAPVLGTRWYWWWLVALTPYGLGLLFWLAREHPWARSPAPAGTAATRDRGFLGLITGLVAAFLISLALLLLNGVLGGRWVPLPGD
jgi:hypothetical protein